MYERKNQSLEGMADSGSAEENYAILLNGDAIVYCPPEILCPLPEYMDAEERRLLEILNRHMLKFALSGKLILEAEKSSDPIVISEERKVIVYGIRTDESLQKRLREINDQEQGVKEVVRLK